MHARIELTAGIAHIPIFHWRAKAAVNTTVGELVLEFIVDLP
jgi:hypothetical protein